MTQYRYTPADSAYPTMGAELFRFLNRHAEEHYSSRTMMALVRQVDAHEAPLLVINTSPAEVDPLTEVKTGGLNACAVVLRDGRVLLSTHAERRRQGYGAAVLSDLASMRHNLYGQDLIPKFWVAATNIDGQRFLLARNMAVVATRRDNQICYGFPDAPEL